jgi:VanZ family protein
MVAIFIASSIPHPPAPGVSDVWLHAAAYFALTLLISRALARGTWGGVTLLTLTAAWTIAATYGGTMEWLQSYVPNRHAELRDVIANAIGALTAVVGVAAWGIIRRL